MLTLSREISFLHPGPIHLRNSSLFLSQTWGKALFSLPWGTCTSNFKSNWMMKLQVNELLASDSPYFYWSDWVSVSSFVAQNPAASEKLNSTFSCRKTSWTEKICRSSHTPGAVRSGNVIILLSCAPLIASVREIHHLCFLCSPGPCLTWCMLTAKQSVPGAVLERAECCVPEFFHSSDWLCFGMRAGAKETEFSRDFPSA